MGQQIEGARAAVARRHAREAELQRELEGEQRDLDQAKWRLLVEHEAIASVARPTLPTVSCCASSWVTRRRAARSPHQMGPGREGSRR